MVDYAIAHPPYKVVKTLNLMAAWEQGSSPLLALISKNFKLLFPLILLTGKAFIISVQALYNMDDALIVY
jgi:hypothetical protein